MTCDKCGLQSENQTLFKTDRELFSSDVLDSLFFGLMFLHPDAPSNAAMINVGFLAVGDVFNSLLHEPGQVLFGRIAGFRIFGLGPKVLEFKRYFGIRWRIVTTPKCASVRNVVRLSPDSFLNSLRLDNMPFDSEQEILANEDVAQAIRRGFISIADNRVTYRLNQQRVYAWTDPEEWVRAHTIAWLVIARDYPTNRIRTEVTVPRRMPNDFADVMVYRDDQCREPYLVVENKACGQTSAQRNQAIEQLFGNTNSVRAPLGLYDEGDTSFFFDVGGFPPTERLVNRLGDRNAVPRQYGETPEFAHIAGEAGGHCAGRYADARLANSAGTLHHLGWWPS